MFAETGAATASSGTRRGLRHPIAQTIEEPVFCLEWLRTHAGCGLERYRAIVCVYLSNSVLLSVRGNIGSKRSLSKFKPSLYTSQRSLPSRKL